MLKTILIGTVVVGLLASAAAVAVGVSPGSWNQWVTAGEFPAAFAFAEGEKEPGPPKGGPKKPKPPKEGKKPGPPPKGGPKKPGPGGPHPKPPGPLHIPPHVELTADQTMAVEELTKEYGPRIQKLDEERKRLDDEIIGKLSVLLTAEQKEQLGPKFHGKGPGKPMPKPKKPE